MIEFIMSCKEIDLMDNPLISSFIQSGVFGKLILLSLLFLSVYIWTIIQTKYLLLSHIRDKTNEFMNEYLKIGDNLFQPMKHERLFKELPAYQLFHLFKEEMLIVMEEERGIDENDLEALTKQMHRLIYQTKKELDEGVVALATTTTIAPFLGLLGTVWGVMNAFIGMGEMGNASIAAVAPGLSESLVTTAVGLIVAIPSAIAYNLFKSKSQTEISVLKDLALDLLSLVQKKFMDRKRGR